MKKHLLFAVTLLGISTSVFAQSTLKQSASGNRLYNVSISPKVAANQMKALAEPTVKHAVKQTPAPVRCYTVEHEAERRAKNPSLPSPAEFEKWLQGRMQEQAKNKTSQRRASPYQIPVIVHVVHNGEDVGEGANITAAQVYSQIESLTEDFRRLNSDVVNTPAIFQSRAADLEIDFVPATHDPDGNLMAEPGIHRYDGGLAEWDMRDDIETVLKPATSWDPSQYCNMWTVQFGSTPLADGGTGGLLGYAQFPEGSGLAGMPGGTQSSDTDGLVMGYLYFGNSDKDPGNTFSLSAPYDKGRTTTHEIGHWVGLRHIWGDGGCMVDDYVDDTPAASGPNYDCDATYDSCTTDAEQDMTQNYMDYSSDPCMNLFTEGQKARVWAVMEASTRRAELPSASSYTPTTNDAGIAKASFTKDCDGNLAGEALLTNFATSGTLTTATIQVYVDDVLSSSFSWTGALSALQSEVISLSSVSLSSGGHTVEVIAVNPNGTGDTNASNDAYSTTITIPKLSGDYSQGFETGTLALEDFVLTSGTESNVGVDDVAANGGSFGIYLEGNSSADYPAAGSGPTEAEGFDASHSHFASAALCYDATNATSLQLSFDYALNFGINNVYTNFRYRVMADNGSNYSSGVIQPSGADAPWTSVSLNLDGYVGGKLQVFFEANCKYQHNSDLNGVSGTGNGAYVDNVVLTYATSLPEISLSSTTGTQVESSNAVDGCRSYIDYQLPLNIENAPDADAQIRFSLSGSATEVSDFELLTPSIIFPAGATTSQNLEIRVYDDQDVESSETIVLNLSLSGSSNAVLNAGSNKFTLTVTDNDNSLEPNTSTQTLLTENFESGLGSFTEVVFGGHSTAGNFNAWRSGTQTSITGGSAYVSNGTTSSSYANKVTELALRSPLIDATGMQDVAISFDYTAGGEADYDYGYLVYALESDPSNYSQLDGPYVLTGGSVYTVSGTLPATFDNERFYLAWYWVNDDFTRTAPALVVDNIEVTAQLNVATIATELNSTNSAYFGPYQTVHFYDDVTGKLIATLANSSAHDYGCTTIEIERNGEGATEFWNAGIENGITDKTFTITPTNNNSAGNYDITLYYTEGEIAAWETTTGKNRSVMGLAKVSGSSVNSISPGNYPSGTAAELSASVSLLAFGDEWAIAGTFTTGFSGFGAGDPGPAPVPLPVDLLSFSAQAKGADIALNWETATEYNAEYFSVEYSAGGIAYTELGRVAATGFSNMLQSYDFHHRKPGPGRHYYRLKTVDIDGSYEYSKVITSSLTVSGLQLHQLMPNPTTNAVTLILDTADEHPLAFRISNMQGTQVFARQMAVHRGRNLLKVEFPRLQPGMYLVEITDGFDTIKQKLLIQ